VLKVHTCPAGTDTVAADAMSGLHSRRLTGPAIAAVWIAGGSLVGVFMVEHRGALGFTCPLNALILGSRRQGAGSNCFMDHDGCHRYFWPI
jgi:hypothetical protein